MLIAQNSPTPDTTKHSCKGKNDCKGQGGGNRYTGITEFGGGVDIRTPIRNFFPISLRLELRDYYTVNAANYGTSLRQQGQHDLVPAGGFVIHF